MIDNSKEGTGDAGAQGGFVKETGLALVHQGEFIMPARGAEAEIESAPVKVSGAVNYYFPVEIEVMGAIPEQERASIQASIWSQLFDALERSG